MTTFNTKIKSAINADQSKAWLDHLKKLVAQGDLLKLAHSEESNLPHKGDLCASVSVVRRAYMECTAATLGGSFLGTRGIYYILESTHPKVAVESNVV